MFELFEWLKAIEFYKSRDFLIINLENYIMITILLLLYIIVCILIAGWLLPRLFIRPDYKGLASHDRGLKRYTFDEGRAIVYEPVEESKKYVDQYIVSMNNGEKFLKCKVADGVRSIEYDVIAFNSRDKALDVLAVADRVSKKKELTSAVSLPTETAYISLLVKRVNGVRVTKKPTVYYSGVKLSAYVVLSAAVMSLPVLTIKNIIGEMLSAFSKDIEIISDFKTVLITAAISVLCSILVIRIHCTKDIKIKNDSKICALIKKIFEMVRGVRHGKKSTANFKRFLSIFTSRKLR